MTQNQSPVTIEQQRLYTYLPLQVSMQQQYPKVISHLAVTLENNCYDGMWQQKLIKDFNY